jgi:geranylgeranyl reductase family protein
MTARCDLAVVGAGFAGLVAARRAAERGLDVLVLDRKAEPGRPVHTTGILTAEAAALLPDLPPALVRAVPGVRLYAPNRRFVDLASPGYGFLATDTPNLLRFLADTAARAGARFAWGRRVAAGRRNADDVILDDGAGGVSARYVLGADGARSAVAEAFGLGRNRRFLVGLEAEYEGLGGVASHALHCFVHRAMAPGYIGWAVPGTGGIVQLGLAARRAEPPALDAFVRHASGVFDFAGARVVARRSGLIPVGGRVRPAGAARVLLVGDAAGAVSPLTAGGIFPALEAAPRAADAIADFLAGRAPDPAFSLPATYPRYRTKAVLRRALDLGPPNGLVNAALGTRPFQALARLVYFHTAGLKRRDGWQALAAPAAPARDASPPPR